MKLLSELKDDKRLWGTCPSCSEEFRLVDGALFSAEHDFPEEALVKIAERKELLKVGRHDLRDRRRRMTEIAQATAESVNLGNILEHIIPSFDNFQFATKDCRSLLRPIDYIVFPGLSGSGIVDSMVFLEVKSGSGRLSSDQKKIKEAINAGLVEFKTCLTKPGDQNADAHS